MYYFGLWNSLYLNYIYIIVNYVKELFLTINIYWVYNNEY